MIFAISRYAFFSMIKILCFLNILFRNFNGNNRENNKNPAKRKARGAMFAVISQGVAAISS
jgi:hypothetical protein